MFNKFADPKCTSGYAINEKKQIAKFAFSSKKCGFKEAADSFCQ